MSSKTNWLEDQVINHVLRNTAMTSPTTVYVGLFTVAPGEAGGGTEVTGGSYAREAVTFAAPTTGSTSNSAQITFTTATASWGTVLAIALFNASSAGDMMYYTTVTSKLIDNGDTATIAASAISVSED